jgi:hypothetical protein
MKVHILLLPLCAASLAALAWGQAGPRKDLVAKLAAAQKPAVGQALIIGGQQVCGPEGNATNPRVQELNINKNRTDIPSSYVAISWNDAKNLPPSKVSEIQGAPVTVIGYLSNKVNVEGAESTNCDLTQPDEVDWHMYLTAGPNHLVKQALIVETTPRTRPLHKWTTEMLGKYVNTDQKVRISGWLLYDFEHIDVIGKERATVWEIHPITRIEVQSGNGWVDVEQ